MVLSVHYCQEKTNKMRVKETTIDEIFNAPNFEDFVIDYGKSGNPNLIHNRPDKANYLAMEKAGALKVFGAFDDDGCVIGVVTVAFVRTPHFDTKLASIESIWCREDHRKTRLGLELLSTARKTAKDAGLAGVYVGCKADSRFDTLLSHIATPMHKVYWMNA